MSLAFVLYHLLEQLHKNREQVAVAFFFFFLPLRP